MIVSHSPVFLAEIQLPIFACSAGAALTLITKRCGFRFQWCRSPLAHHTHTDPVPRLGGVAVFLAITLACALCSFLESAATFLPALTILGASLPVLLVGAYDDLCHASPKSKILAQLAGASVLLGAHWRAGGSISIYELLFVPAFLVIATNSFNLVDGIDGLASGTAVIMGVSLAIVNAALGNIALAALSAFVAAASLGFMPFNLLRSRIFLGDSGSLSLGFILAAIAIETPIGSASRWATLLFFGYPLLETALSILRRFLKARSVCRPDREHLHHKLLHSGYSALRASTVLWLISLAFASLAVMLCLGASTFVTLCAGMVLCFSLAKAFGYMRSRWLRLLRRRLTSAKEEQPLPDIAGYLPFK